VEEIALSTSTKPDGGFLWRNECRPKGASLFSGIEVVLACFTPSITIAVFTPHCANTRCCTSSSVIEMSLTRPPIVDLTAVSRSLIQPLLHSRQIFLVLNFGPAHRFGGELTVFQYSVGDFESAPTDVMSQSGQASSSVPARFGQKRQTRDIAILFHSKTL
jgi:hypothetical protein